MANAIPSGRSTNPPQGAGLKNYLKEAFFFRWNLLFFLGGLAGAAIAPLSDVTLPLVVASELTYLTGLIAIPRFRAAIDAKVHATRRTEPEAPTASPSLVSMLAGLPTEARRRFERLHTRCVEMRAIAVGVRGAADAQHEQQRLHQEQPEDQDRHRGERLGISAALGLTSTVSMGIAAPIAKVNAEAKAACTGRALRVSEMPSSSRA